MEQEQNCNLYERYLISRAYTILENMMLENDREWWQFWIPRWQISDEPLRNDAKNLLPLLKDFVDKSSEI